MEFPLGRGTGLGLRWGLERTILVSMITLGEIALIGATLYGMAPGIPEQGTVLVSDGFLRVVAVDAILPDGCQEVDCSGLFIVPGLLDAAAGHTMEHDILYVAAGVTTVRHTGTELALGLAAARASSRDQVPGPRILFGGPMMAGETARPGVQWPIAAKGEDAVLQLQSLLGELAKSEGKLDGLVNDRSLAVTSWMALVPAARDHGLSLWGPLPDGATLAQAIELGQGGILGLAPLLPRDGSWEAPASQAGIEAAILLAAKGETALVPMLGVLARVFREHPADAPELALLSMHVVPLWEAERKRWLREVTPELKARLQASLHAQEAALAGLIAAGATVVPGSGAPNPWLLPGRSLVEELIQWQAAGVPAQTVLYAATRGASKALIPQEPLAGTLLDGAVADLVILAEDPAQDVAALRDPVFVMVRGQLLSREEIGERMNLLGRVQAQARDAVSKRLTIPNPPTVPNAEVLLSGQGETFASGIRQSQEHWSVSRLPGGDRLYASHLVHLPTAGQGVREVTVVQRISKGVLASFEIVTRDTASGREMVVKGVKMNDSDQMQVERRVDRIFISNTPLRDQPAFVDVSPALTTMILVQHCPPGENPVLSIEGATAEVRIWPWVLRVGEDGILRIQNAQGGLLCGVDAKGVPILYGQMQKDWRRDHVTFSSDAHGGRGAPPVASRRAQVNREEIPSQVPADGQTGQDK